MRKAVILSVLLLMVSGMASATLGSPSGVKVDSGNSFFSNYNDEVIVFSWTADAYSGSERVTIQPRDINTQIEGEINQPVTIEISHKTSKATYDLRDGGRNDIKELDYAYQDYDWGKKLITAPDKSERKQDYRDWANSNCERIQGDGLYYYDEWLTGYLNENVKGEVICSTYGSKVASIGEIESTPDEEMDATFTLNAGGETSSVTVGNSIDSETSKNLGGLAKIDFQGGIETGYSFPEPNDELVAQSNRFDDNWRIIQNTDTKRFGTSYSEYFDWVDNQDTEDKYSQILSDSNNIDETSIEDTSETKARSAVESYAESEFSGNDVTINGRSLRNGELVLSGDKSSSFPTFRVIVKADEVGWTIPEATPRLDSVNTVDSRVKEGRRGTVEFGVTNTGNGQGSFTARMQCGGNFESLGGSYNIANIGAGESRTGSLQYTFTSGSGDQKNFESQCEVTVENLQDDSESDEGSTTVRGEQEEECTPDRHITNVKNTDNDPKLETQILECSSDGLSKSKVKTCDDNQRAKRLSATEFKCEDQINPQPEICGDDIDNDNDGEVDENPPCGSGLPNPSTEICDDGLDNDDDGSIDGNDSDCQSQKQRCLVNIPNGIGGEISFLCFSEQTFQILKWGVVGISGLIGGFGGFSAGRAFTGFGRRPPVQAQNTQGNNRNNPQMRGRGAVRRRRNPIPLLLGILGFLLGGAIGLWLGVLGAGIVLVGLVVVQVALPFL